MFQQELSSFQDRARAFERLENHGLTYKGITKSKCNVWKKFNKKINNNNIENFDNI